MKDDMFDRFLKVLRKYCDAKIKHLEKTATSNAPDLQWFSIGEMEAYKYILSLLEEDNEE